MRHIVEGEQGGTGQQGGMWSRGNAQMEAAVSSQVHRRSPGRRCACLPTCSQDACARSVRPSSSAVLLTLRTAWHGRYHSLCFADRRPQLPAAVRPARAHICAFRLSRAGFSAQPVPARQQERLLSGLAVTIIGTATATANPFNLHDSRATYDWHLHFTEEEIRRGSNRTASKGVAKHLAV